MARPSLESTYETSFAEDSFLRKEFRFVHELFAGQAARTPRAVAVTFQNAHLTYEELDRRANQLAHYLKKRGTRPETLVAICLERSMDVVIAILAVLKAGAAYVPIDPANPKERLSFILEDTRAPLVITSAAIAPSLPRHPVECICVDTEATPIAAEPTACPVAELSPENLAYVIYTSGSTGKPKGVMVTHANVARLFSSTAARFGFNSSDVWPLFHSYAFDFSVWELWGALLFGGRLVVVPLSVARSPEAFYRLLVEERVTILNQISSAFKQLIAVDEESSFAGDLRLRTIIFGGDTLPFANLAGWMERHGSMPTLVHTYGITETTVLTTFYTVSSRDINGKRGSVIGTPMPDSDIYILDETLGRVPVRVPGEIYVGGPGVTRGYLNRPELTEQRFLPDPFKTDPNARMYKSGDRGRFLEDGTIEYLGRLDQQVKIRGFRIELGEVEAALRQHPDVRDCVVDVREETSGDKKLAAYVVYRSGAAPFVSELRRLLQIKLPEYMVPSYFVALEKIPLNQSSKVDRAALPDPRAGTDNAGYVEPEGDMERRVAGLFERILDVRPVGRTSNFFDLGGHSLLAVRLSTEVERALGIDLPVAKIFQAATVQQLAQAITDRKEAAGEGSLVTIQAGSFDTTPFFCVHPNDGNPHRYRELARNLEPEQPFYLLQSISANQDGDINFDVEDVAATYLAEIRKIQPHSPYRLGGFCFGGLVAFEMAQQLKRRGESVELLALIDTFFPGQPAHFVPQPKRSLFWWADMDLGGLLARTRGQKLASLRTLFQERVVMYLKLRVARLSKRLGRETRFMRDSLKLAAANVRATDAYVPKPYSGRISLFWCTEWAFRAHHDRRLGWSDVASGGLEVHTVPGDHATLFQAPNVAVLAEKLQRYLTVARRIAA